MTRFTKEQASKRVTQLQMLIVFLIIADIFSFAYFFYNKKTKDKKNEKSIQIDSLESKINRIDSVRNSIPYSYAKSTRSEYFRNYILIREATEGFKANK